MKNTFNKNFFIHVFIILILTVFINAQPQCHINRFPEVMPLQYGEQASINLEKYIWGSNITYSVQPNDFHSNVQPQYSCKKIWTHRLGKIIQTEKYQLKINNKTQLFIAMLGGSSYFDDLYLIYYGIKATTVENQNEFYQKNEYSQGEDKKNLGQDDVLVLQVPRYKLKNCKRFIVTSNGSHAEFLLDCMSPTNPMNKIMATTIIPLNQPTPINPKWIMLQSPIYLPQQLIPQLNITSSLTIIQTSNKMKYLIRMIMTQFADYIEVWRWTQDGREIIGLYDSGYFMDQGTFTTDDVDLRKLQAISNTILVMDLLNGLHVLQLTKTGTLLYTTTLQMQAFNTFDYDPKQELLFMAKRGIIEQFEIKIFSSNNIKANRVDRYHLYGFEQINQMVVQNRFLYVSTNMYLHIIHLTNIPSNYQEYDGSYNVYPELYNQMMVPLTVGFVKVDAAQSMVEISQCETHPPFLHLKAPQFSNQFTVKAVSVINGISSTCELKLKSISVQADDDNVYINGYESENETVFSNRPGRAIMQLQKYAIGKNLEYEISLYNHQIEFEYKIRKVNNQSCQVKRVADNQFDLQQQVNQSNQSSLKLKKLNSQTASNITYTFSIGNWLIVEHPQDRVKEYYKCEKYLNIQCNFIQLYITSSTYTKSVYQLLEEQKTKKQSVLEAVLFMQSNQAVVEVIMVSQNQKNLNDSKQQQDEQNLSMVRSLCRVKLPQGEQYKVGEIKLREDKLYVVLPNIKQIRVYEALLSFEQNQQCHYFGNLNLSSFKHQQQSQRGFYFAPKHVDFDKQQLARPYIVPSFSLNQQNPRLSQISQSIETMFIAQYNQLLIVRLTISPDTITRVQLLKQLTLDRTNEANDIQLIVTLPNLLAVDRTQKMIAQYYLSHTYDRTFVRTYAFYKDNKTDGNIRLIDPNTFAVMAQPDTMNNSYAQVYEIDSIVSSFKQFAKFMIDGTFHVMSFDEDEYEFLTAKLQQTPNLQLICNSTTLTPFPYIQIQIPTPNYNDQPSKQQFFLSSYTQKDSRREVVTLQVASDSSDIEKGTEYPYTTYSMRIQQDQQQAYFEIDDLKWFQGNVWTHRYVCNDCKTGRIKFQDKISLKQKIQLQSFNVPNDFYVAQVNTFKGQYTFETIQGYLLTKMTPQRENNTWLSVENEIMSIFENGIKESVYNDVKQNASYTFSQSLILSSNIDNDPTCIKTSPQEHDLYFVSMCSDYEFLDQSALIELRLYSTTGFKPFVINEYLIQMGDLTKIPNLKAGTKSQKQLIVMSSSLNEQEGDSYDTLFVRFDDNIWIFLIVNGKFELIYTVDKVDFGPDNHLCWIQVIKRKVTQQSSQHSVNQFENDNLSKTTTQYGIIASMCESGIYHIVFTVDPPQQKSTMLKAQKQPLPSFHLLTQQQIDMELQLQKSKIQLPQHSYFLQTIAKTIKNETNQFQLHMIVSNFNSFIWKVSLIQDTLIVSSMELTGIIRRYNQYTPIQVTSHDERYFSVLYKSTQSVNVSQFLALYDTEYYVMNQQKQIKEYFMFSVQRTNDSPVYTNKSEVFQIGNNLFVLKQNQIKIFSVANVLRMTVQKKMPKQIDYCENYQQSENLNIQEMSKSLTFEQRDSHLSQKTANPLTSAEENSILYSQSIIVYVETPTQVNSVTIKLYSIDYFELSGWTIALIVIGGILGIVILYYGLSELWKYYQKKRKLVRLETQLLDEVSSSERDSHDYQRDTHSFDGDEVQNHRPQGRQSQITDEEGTLSRSLLDRYRQFTPQEQTTQQNRNKQGENQQTIKHQNTQDPIKQ